jgi:tetratricopeptide (TPR) repeat protein
LRELAWTLFKIGEFDEVLSVTERALAISPVQPEILALQGNALLRLNRWNEGEVSLIRSLEMNDKLEIAYLGLEYVYRTRNDTQRLIDILSRYLRILPPGSENALRIQGRLQELRTSG